MDSTKRFETKKQLIHRLQEGISFEDGEEYTPREYQVMSTAKANEWRVRKYPKSNNALNNYSASLDIASDEQLHEAKQAWMTAENLERDYWDIVETHSSPLS